jgi:hypothetical protein
MSVQYLLVPYRDHRINISSSSSSNIPSIVDIVHHEIPDAYALWRRGVCLEEGGRWYLRAYDVESLTMGNNGEWIKAWDRQSEK